MPRRGHVEHHPVVPDPKYNNGTVSRFINRVMQRGKKSTAERLIYDAFAIIEEKTKKPPLEVFETALRNAGPSIEVKPTCWRASRTSIGLLPLAIANPLTPAATRTS